LQDSEKLQLQNLVLAPYLQKAIALRSARRRVGGNQFRHQMATLAILIDHHEIDPVLLKASVIHDLLEDMPSETNLDDLRRIDEDGEQVVALMLELTRHPGEVKGEYLARLGAHGSRRAKALKLADRISNLTDLNVQEFPPSYVVRYLDETEAWILPFAGEINRNMETEIRDLIRRRREVLNSKGFCE